MLSANELRIGNYISAKGGKSFQVQLFHINKLQNEKCKFYGTPINEEWLLKFGFEKEKCLTGFRYFRNDIMYHINVYKDQFSITLANSSLYLGFKFVHDLQNKIFALTKKELEIC